MINIRYNLPHINSKYVYWCHFAFLSLEVFRYSFSSRYFSIALKAILHRWRIPSSFVQMSAPKSITRFHHQDAIYLPRPQSLAMVLMVFNLIIKKSETKEETEREGKIIIFCLPITPCSCSFPSLLSGPGLRYWRQTVSSLDAMWPRRNQWERTPVWKKYPANTSNCLRVIVRWI